MARESGNPSGITTWKTMTSGTTSPTRNLRRATSSASTSSGGLPERCCMPGPHSPSECVSFEMMGALFAEAELDAPGKEGNPS